MFHPNTDIIIRKPGPIVDGKQTYTETFARGRVIAFSRRDIDYFGEIQDGKIILVSPPEMPTLPGQIRIDDELYDLVQVRPCRDIDDHLIGCRCAVTGG